MKSLSPMHQNLTPDLVNTPPTLFKTHDVSDQVLCPDQTSAPRVHVGLNLPRLDQHLVGSNQR